MGERPYNKRLPPVGRGQRVGLLGGTFNPAHAGHLSASLVALRSLGLDQVWWLVTPGNPLKDNTALPPLDQRVAGAQRVATDRRIVVTNVEAHLGTHFTVDTLRALRERAAGVRFVWIMGSDNLAGFHRWRRWRAIAGLVPIAVVDRPGSTLRGSRAVAALAGFRVADPRHLADHPAPALARLHGPRSPLSSTALRQAADRR